MDEQDDILEQEGRQDEGAPCDMPGDDEVPG